MDPATAFDPALTALTTALDDPTIDLGIMLEAVSNQVVTMVPSFLGLTMTVHSSGVPVTVTTVAPDAAQSAHACLMLCLTASRATGDSVVFYAAATGAFAGLIATTDPTDPPLSRVFLLDQHLPLIADLPRPIGISGLDELSARNRAIGALIAEGCTLKQAKKVAPQQFPVPGQVSPLKPSA